ncbi:MAG: MFS transporter [Gaiellaceae bacterium MAG52_C11]|nr:MFS transporter [Candidatus Gaiellasilicea maunaloa]
MAPLGTRNFRLLLAATATSTLGSSFATVALAFAVLETTSSVAAVGFVLAATRLPLLLFVLVGGVVGDRLPRRAVMIGSDLARFLSQGVAAALLLIGQAQLWHLLVLFGLGGVAQAFFGPASVGLVPQVAAPEHLQPANALLDLARNSAALVGQIAGGVLVAAFGAGIALAIDSASFLISALAIMSIEIKGTVVVRPAIAFIRDLREGWSEFRSRTWLWVGTMHVALLNAFALVGFFALGPIVAERALGGAAAWGFIGAGFAAGLIAGSAVAARWRPARPLVAAFAAILLAAPQLALLAAAAPTIAIVAAAFLGGGQASFWGALWLTTLQRQVPEHALSRVAAYGSVGGLVLAPVGYAVVGSLAAAVGIDWVLAGGAAWIVVSTLVVVALPSIRNVRSSRTGAATTSLA